MATAPVSPAGPPLLSRLLPGHRVLFAAACEPPAEAPLNLSPLEWDRLCRTAEREKAASTTWAYVKSRLGTAVLPDGAERLRKLAMVTEFRMLFLQQTLTDSVAALHRVGIECVLLKGAALATGYYRAFVDRPMLDLDLLVRPDRAAEAVQVLLASGWRLPGSEEKIAITNESLHHLPVLYHSSGVEVNLEVHVDVLPLNQPLTWGAVDVWAGAEPCHGVLTGSFRPSAPDLVLHACVHFVWSHLLRTGSCRTFRDIRMVLAHGAFDWRVFVTRARAAKAGTCCYWTLRLGQRLVGLDVPPEVLRALKPPVGTIALGALERHLLSVMIPVGADCPSVTLRRRMWEWAVQPEWSGHAASRPWLTDDPDGVDQDEVATPQDGLSPGVSVWSEPGAGGRTHRYMRYAWQLVRHA